MGTSIRIILQPFCLLPIKIIETWLMPDLLRNWTFISSSLSRQANLFSNLERSDNRCFIEFEFYSSSLLANAIIRCILIENLLRSTSSGLNKQSSRWLMNRQTYRSPDTFCMMPFSQQQRSDRLSLSQFMVGRFFCTPH